MSEDKQNGTMGAHAAPERVLDQHTLNRCAQLAEQAATECLESETRHAFSGNNQEATLQADRAREAKIIANRIRGLGVKLSASEGVPDLRVQDGLIAARAARKPFEPIMAISPAVRAAANAGVLYDPIHGSRVDPGWLEKQALEPNEEVRRNRVCDQAIANLPPDVRAQLRPQANEQHEAGAHWAALSEEERGRILRDLCDLVPFGERTSGADPSRARSAQENADALVRRLTDRAGASPADHSVGSLMREAAEYITLHPTWIGLAERRYASHLMKLVEELLDEVRALRDAAVAARKPVST